MSQNRRIILSSDLKPASQGKKALAQPMSMQEVKVKKPIR